MCANAHPSTVLVLTYSAMLKHIASHFGYVKLPKNLRLGKCSACIHFTQQRLRAKSPLEAAQFASAWTHHLALSSAERLSYKDQAKSQPSLYMSLIIDLSFLLVGHTHEDIDQLFSTAQTKFHTSSIHTSR